MATATVSGSVDVNIKRLAAIYIKRKGLTPNEVIKLVWNHIASTGEIPCLESDAETPARHSDAYSQLIELRTSVPTDTPLDTLGRDELREELMSRDA